MVMPERWLPVPGFEGVYEVSSEGRVRSLAKVVNAPYKKGTRTLPERVLAGHDHNGYRRVDLGPAATSKGYLVHRLVAAAFLGPEPEGMVVCHNDGNPSNNVVSNLRYDTSQGNAADRKLHGTEYKLRNTHCPQGHEFAGDNLAIRPILGGGTKRACKTCHRNGVQASRRRQKARLLTAA